MKFGFYPRLAFTAMSKNRSIYFPYFLTCSGICMMFYITAFLTENPVIAQMQGGQTLQTFLAFGKGVIGFFACIFLFYTNSFLIHRRKKEFGLYSILGMNKWNLTRILCCETLILYLASSILGLFCGILFSKAAELGVTRLLNAAENFHFSLNLSSVCQTLILTGAIFLLILLHSIRQVHSAHPIELLHSEKTGEKPPKNNWIFGILGIILLVIAYIIAVMIQNPIEALALFFVAVLLVIVSTYLIFIAGSIMLCRFLQKNKRYYYKTRHFISVSSMVYRMKRNGAGLASICILSTMVLVMISTTSCLFLGIDHIIKKRCSHDIVLNLQTDNPQYLEQVNQIVDECVALTSVSTHDNISFHYTSLYGYYIDNQFVFDSASLNSTNLVNFQDLYDLIFLTANDYELLTGSPTILQSDEVLVYSGELTIESDQLIVEDTPVYHIAEKLSSFPDIGRSPNNSIAEPVYFVAADVDALAPIFQAVFQTDAPAQWFLNTRIAFNINCDTQTQIQLRDLLADRLFNLKNGYPDIAFQWPISYAFEKQDSYGTFGGLFFLGILLGIVFLFATVLIMYYKQISEGYEDQSHFEILGKVGMSNREIRQSINSQVLTVFFLPLFAAGLHVIFAFPMIAKLMLLFGITSTDLFFKITGFCYLAFAVFYILTYKITSRSYYHLVKHASTI